jgi:hypothetical protein
VLSRQHRGPPRDDASQGGHNTDAQDESTAYGAENCPLTDNCRLDILYTLSRRAGYGLSVQGCRVPFRDYSGRVVVMVSSACWVRDGGVVCAALADRWPCCWLAV